MNQETKYQVKNWRPALVLAAGLLVVLLTVLVTPVLFAQDDDVPGEEPEVFISTSEEDLESLPPLVRQRLLAEDGLAAADDFELDQSTKTSGFSQAQPGDNVTYTIVARNSGDADTPILTVEDALPAELAYVSHEFKLPVGGLQTGGGVNGNVVTWEGNLAAGGSVEIVIVAQVKNNTALGTTIVNTAEITAGDKSFAPQASVSVVEKASSPIALLPMVVYGEKPATPDITSIEATRPTSQNVWTVSWSAPGGINYELQESNSPGFENAALIDVGPEATMTFNPTPSPFNTYYYRVRTKSDPLVGNWSQTIKVVGGYYDDFSNQDSNWEMRRKSYYEEVNSWYERTSDYTALVLEVSDRWDLGLVSPLAEAPSIPYAIELRVKSVQPGWQKGVGFVFEGDSSNPNCPSDGDQYEQDECFNQFYEFMLVEGADKKNLQVQRISGVCWKCSPGGIPVHRKVAKNWYIEKISGVSWDDYNIMRVEVRENSMDFYAGKSGGSLQHQLSIDENYMGYNPYFGVISTTQEYSNSVGRYTYFQAIPMDN